MTLTNDVHAAMRRRLAQTDERAGQAAFNALARIEPELAALATAENIDPFHNDEILPDFWAWLAGWDS